MAANEKGSSPEHARLYQAILHLENEEDCAHFFEDICTIKELSEMAKRLKVAEMLLSGHSYIQISAQTGVSTATISRVNRCLSWGSGGYEKALNALHQDEREEPQS